MATTVGVVLLVLPAAACAGPSPAAPAPSAPSTPSAPSASLPDPGRYAAELVAGTNAARAAAGLPALAASACATDVAAPRAQALVGGDGLTHAPLTDALAACAPRTTAAENLSRTDAPAADVVTAWLGSPGHRANLLDPALTELGVACVPDGVALLCSQVFLGP